MNFSSLTFIFCFFPISIILFLLINKFNRRVADVFLILISYIFYAWSNYYLALFLFIYSLFVYFVGKKVFHNKPLLIISILLCTGFLFYSKYTNFILYNLNRFIGIGIESINIFVPLGISFIVFETISYLVDIYRGERSGDVIETFLFLSLFSKVISGPIVLWKDFIKDKREISIDKCSNGIKRIIIGLSKKVIIADTLGAFFTKMIETGGFEIISIFGWLCYITQLYFDFSGYSDIALGISECFGYSFKENFNYPYISTSVSEFFRRWHISLGTWFKEYLYIPLGGNRRKVYRNLFIVYIVTGLWHGTGYNFVLWGIYLGIIVMVERYLSKKQFYLNTPRIIKWFITMILIGFSWMIFRFDNISHLVNYFMNLKLLFNFEDLIYARYFKRKVIVVLFVGLFGMFFSNAINNKINKFFSQNKFGVVIKYIILICLFIVCYIQIINSSFSPFLYFQF